MKKVTTLFETVSITSITYYIIMTIALSMIFVPNTDTALAARISRVTGIGVEFMGIVISLGIMLSIMSRAWWVRLIGISPYLLFFVGVCLVAVQQVISIHVVLIYAGYGVQLILTLRNGNGHVA